MSGALKSHKNKTELTTSAQQMLALGSLSCVLWEDVMRDFVPNTLQQHIYAYENTLQQHIYTYEVMATNIMIPHKYKICFMKFSALPTRFTHTAYL